jgi:site-specific DNA recombinase
VTWETLHGHASATAPGPGRAKSTCVREDQILPHLAAIAILLRGSGQAPSRSVRNVAQVTTPARAADLIDSLRTAGVILTYDPDQRTLRCQDHVAVTIGNDR